MGKLAHGFVSLLCSFVRRRLRSVQLLAECLNFGLHSADVDFESRIARRHCPVLECLLAF